MIVERTMLKKDPVVPLWRASNLHTHAWCFTPGSRTFIVEKRIDGRVKRINLGRYGERHIGTKARMEPLE